MFLPDGKITLDAGKQKWRDEADETENYVYAIALQIEGREIGSNMQK